MLCQFSVKNYKSIKDEVVFDMEATNISEYKDRVIKTIDGEEYLPISAIYGPNGGGKSNVLESISVLVRFILAPIMNMPYGNVIPFLFSKETQKEPTEFEIVFKNKLAEYKYRIHILRNEVKYESLYQYSFKTNRMSELFERVNDKIILKNEFKKFAITNDISKNVSLLSFIGKFLNNNEIVNDIFDFFVNKIRNLNFSNPFAESLNTNLINNPKVKKIIISMMNEMDIDIVDYRFVQSINNTIEVYTTHKVNNELIELNLNEESSGTKKIFNILPFIGESIYNGTTLIIDELDAKLHPLLLKYIIEKFNNMDVNKNMAQLIFTSHDLTTMTNEIFRRDEIWFVCKNNKQSSQLYSLVEFKNDDGSSVRKDAKYNKQYLEGKYGADPYLRKIVNWENYHE